MRLLGNGLLPQIVGDDGSGGAASPLDVAGCVLWLDGSDASSLFVDAGTTPVSVDSDVIYQWNDKSGEGNHAVQSSATSRPAYRTAVQNGLAVSRFDGSNDSLIVPQPVTVDTATFCIFLVSKANDATTERIPLHIGVGANGMGIAQYTWTTGQKGFLLGGVAWVEPFIPADTGWHLWLLRRSGGTATLYDSGIPIVDTASEPVTPTTQTSLGDYNGSAPAACDIAEAIVHENISVASVNLLGNYLASKWDIAWTDIV